jgi:hypothetical protein
MAGKFCPGTLPWSFFDGTYTLSADGETITGSGAIRSGWINAGTLAKIDWAGSGTFSSVQVRTSATLPASRQDTTPIQLATSERQVFYDASLNSLPNSQSWTQVQAGTGHSNTASGGVLTISATNGYTYYTRSPSFTPGDLVTVVARVRVNAGHSSYQALWVELPYGGVLQRLSLQLTGNSGVYFTTANQLKLRNNLVGVNVDNFTFVVGTWYDIRMAWRSSGGALSEVRVYVRPAGSYALTDLDGYTDYGPQTTSSTAGSQPSVYIGNMFGSAPNDCSWQDVALHSGSEWFTATDGATAFTNNRGFVQIKGSLSGALTELDIQNSLSAPDALTVDGTGATSGVIHALASAATSGNVYLWERTGPSTSDSEFHSSRAYAWADCEDGQHTVTVYQCTPDGVRGTAATDTVTLPVTTPTGPSKPTTPAYDGGALYFYRPTPGTAALANIIVESAAQADGPWSTLTTTADSGVTWSSSRAAASAFAVVPGDTTWYRNYATATDGTRSGPSDPVYGGDPNQRTCLVSFAFPSSVASVAYYYSHPMTVRGGSYAKTSGTVTLTNGAGSISLPRTEAATCADGDTGRPFVTFIAPGYSSDPMPREIPDSASATFASLSSPG